MTILRKDSDPWVKVPAHSSSIRLRLFCFSHAGGGASVFLHWARSLPSDIELCAVQLPGREERLNERPFENWDELVEKAAAALRPWLTVPFVLLGHSLGATLAFELARYWLNCGVKCSHLFVCGRTAPHMPVRESITYNLPDAGFIAALRRLKGTPEEILNEPELLGVFLPTLRADFRLSETYLSHQTNPLDTPISAYGGVEDRRVPVDSLDGWRDYSSTSFRRVLFPGGHFFLHEFPGAVIAELVRELKNTCDTHTYSR